MPVKPRPRKDIRADPGDTSVGVTMSAGKLTKDGLVSGSLAPAVERDSDDSDEDDILLDVVDPEQASKDADKSKGGDDKEIEIIEPPQKSKGKKKAAKGKGKKKGKGKGKAQGDEEDIDDNDDDEVRAISCFADSIG